MAAGPSQRPSDYHFRHPGQVLTSQPAGERYKAAGNCRLLNRRFIMTDILAIFSLLILFPVALLYVFGCDRLKGSRR
jgi:hypothetical protein